MRVSWILLRHVSLELWRHLLLTTVILVLVTAFGVTVQHYARGKLSAFDTLTFMGLASVPMLAYALPFAGCFAATLAYHRLVQERELMAAHAGGMSLPALLAPAAATGLALSVALSGLNEQVIPRFLHQMAEVISTQAASLISRAIGQGEAVQAQGFMIYADEAIRLPKGDGGAQARLRLFGPHVLQLNEDGSVKNWGAGATAVVWIMPPREGDLPGLRVSEVIYSVEEAVGDAGPVADGRVGSLSGALQMPGGVSDDPKFLTFGELREARRNPDPLSLVDTPRRDLAFHLAQRRVMDRLVSEIRARGSAQLRGPDGERLIVRTGGIAWSDEPPGWRLEPRRTGLDAGTIEIERYRPGASGTRAVERFEAAGARVSAALTGDPGDRGLALTIVAREVRTALAQPEAGRERLGGMRQQATFGPLQIEDDPVAECLAMSSGTLLAEIEARNDRLGYEDRFLAPPAEVLRDRLSDLDREILSKQHERMALSVATLVMVIGGALAAVRFQNTPPLVVFLWSFFPALGTVLAISGGQQMTHDFGVPGLAMLWGGVAALALAAAGTFVLAARH
ncbi:MAG: LptF/LptG family permease [Planctomycetota bacterium]